MKTTSEMTHSSILKPGRREFWKTRAMVHLQWGLVVGRREVSGELGFGGTWLRGCGRWWLMGLVVNFASSVTHQMTNQPHANDNMSDDASLSKMGD